MLQSEQPEVLRLHLTPMAAVVFTLEEVGDLNAKMLGSIIISSVVASVVGQFFLGTGNAFPEFELST